MIEEPNWRYELDRAIIKRNLLVREAAEIDERYNDLQVQREKLTALVEAGDQRSEIFGVKYGKNLVAEAYRELVRVRDQITLVSKDRIRLRHDWRDSDYAINFLRDRLKMDKEGAL